jgi:PAS domain-containing protein
MRRVCSWCGKDLGETDDAATSKLVTHGICEECTASFEASLPRSLRDCLEDFAEPILCVDGNGRVLAGNRKMLHLLHKESEPVAGLACGEAFECSHSRLPEGCGRTEYCGACGIRRCLELTLATGEGVERSRVLLDRDDGCGEVTRVHLLVSTEQRDGVILLRIDEIGETSRLEEVPARDPPPGPATR